MATVRCTSGQICQKLDAHYVSALQGKLLTSDKEEDGRTRGTFLFFSFVLSSFHLFTTNIT
jgi:hypothetical protein